MNDKYKLSGILTQKLAESRGQIFMANQSIIKLTKANAIRSAFMKYLHDRFGKEHVNQTPHGEIEAGLLIFAAGEAHKNPPINGAAKEQITKKIGAANAS